MAYNNNYGNRGYTRKSNYTQAKPQLPTADNITVQELQRIEKNYEKFQSLISSIEDADLKKSLTNLATELKTRISVAPSATKTEFVGAYAGGLVQTSLLTLRNMLKMNEALELNLSKDDMILVALTFGLGKIGSKDKDYYIAQTSQWHIERGMRFEINKELSDVMSPNIRSIWWLNQYGVNLSENALYAISSLSSLSGTHTMSSLELFQAPPLAILLQTAFRLVCSQASNTPKKSVLE